MPSQSKFSWLSYLFIAILILLALAVVFLLFRPKTGSPQKITLKYTGLWDTPATIQPLIDEYQASHPNITIDYTSSSPQEYGERLLNSLKQGSSSDIIRYHNTWLPMLENYLAPAPSAVFTTQMFSQEFFPVASVDLVRRGHIYAVPLHIDGLAMIVNESLLQAANQSIPTNWDELRRTATILTKCDTPSTACTPRDRILISGLAMGSPENVDYWPETLSVLLMQNQVNLNSLQGKQAEDVIDYFTGFVKTYHTWDNTLPRSTQAFISGKTAIMFAPAARATDILTASKGFKVGIHPIPQVPTDPRLGETPTTFATYWVEGVSKSSPHPQEAWEFLKFLSSKNAQTKLYKLAASSRAFGNPSSRIDLKTAEYYNPYLLPFVTQAPYYRSWYMSSETFDGPAGINSQLISAYATAMQKNLSGSSTSETIRLINEGTSRTLSVYGLAPRLPTGN